MTNAQVTCKRVIIGSIKRSLPFHALARHQGHRSFLRTTRSSCLSCSLPRVQHCGSPNHVRKYATSTISSILLPPTIYIGLLGALWLYKCCMMVLFQNKIIYMPSIPPFSRRERLETYKPDCHPVTWEEKRTRSEDGTELALCVGEMPMNASRDSVSRQVTLLYFQGNASSLPPRLPALSGVLKRLEKQQSGRLTSDRVRYTCVALSYRGYWTSRGRPSQRGIELDASATLEWVNRYKKPGGGAEVILWGQSLGAGVALSALYRHYRFSSRTGTGGSIMVKGIVLETPFASVREMLVALYPQKWLPYRYLWPFLRSDWNSVSNLHQLSSVEEFKTVPIFILRAGSDEIVPAEQTDRILTTARNVGMDMKMHTVPSALHNEATNKHSGQVAITEFISKVINR